MVDASEHAQAVECLQRAADLVSGAVSCEAQAQSAPMDCVVQHGALGAG